MDRVAIDSAIDDFKSKGRMPAAIVAEHLEIRRFMADGHFDRDRSIQIFGQRRSRPNTYRGVRLFGVSTWMAGAAHVIGEVEFMEVLNKSAKYAGLKVRER